MTETATLCVQSTRWTGLGSVCDTEVLRDSRSYAEQILRQNDSRSHVEQVSDAMNKQTDLMRKQVSRENDSRSHLEQVSDAMNSVNVAKSSGRTRCYLSCVARFA